MTNNIEDFEEEEQNGYLKIDHYNEKTVDRIAAHYVDILERSVRIAIAKGCWKPRNGSQKHSSF